MRPLQVNVILNDIDSFKAPWYTKEKIWQPREKMSEKYSLSNEDRLQALGRCRSRKCETSEKVSRYRRGTSI